MEQTTKSINLPERDKMIAEPEDQKAEATNRRKRREVRQVSSIAAVRQLVGGAIVNVDGVEEVITGRKVSILIEG
jgi:hypothetical protein